MIGTCSTIQGRPDRPATNPPRLKARLVLALAALLALNPAANAAPATKDYAVLVSATVQSDPATITLSWAQDSSAVPTSYEIARKLADVKTWTVLATLSGNETSYTDESALPNTKYEYQVKKAASGYTGYGYVMAGIEIPLREDRGKLILIVDRTHAADLTNELSRLQQDLTGDGWQVIRHDVNRDDTPVEVKTLIKADYDDDPDNVRSVFLFGHVPVPYSGDIVPDGHNPNHRGAWPADIYYADIDWTWGDAVITSTNATDARQHNRPGDGKFDFSTATMLADLEVGRVDLANLPQFALSEKELLRQYLNKDHNFRHKLIAAAPRGLVTDFFGVFSGSAFAATGWRNFAALFGATNVVESTNWHGTLATNSFLCTYGCGGGSFTSVDGVTTTPKLTANDPQAVFSFLFGSYFGDWDTTNNVMRAVLATPTYTLTSAWAGRPHWFVHHLGLGETIGHSTRLTQVNNNSASYKQINPGSQQIHIALMGDPTLRLHPLAPPTAPNAQAEGSQVSLSWVESVEPVLGYHVYRAASETGPFTRVSPTLVTTNEFTDTGLTTGAYTYMIRGVRLEVSASGSYYNASQGAFVDIAVTAALPVALIPTADQWVELGSAWSFSEPEAAGGCGAVNLTVLYTTTNTTCGNSFEALRVWQAADGCGSTAFSTNLVTVVDTTAPKIATPSSRTVELGSAWSFDPPSSADLGGAVTVTVVGTTTNPTPSGMFSATCIWQLADACGNSAQTSQTVTVNDTTAPTITKPADKTVELGSEWTFDSPAVSDLGGAVTLGVVGMVTNSAHGVAFTAVCTWSATDSSGNMAQTSQTVTIIDTTAPAFSGPGDKTVTHGTSWTFDIPSVSDASGDVIVAVLNTVTNGNAPAISATCTWIATDASGNTNHWSQTVTVEDIGPVTVSLTALGEFAYEGGESVGIRISRTGSAAKPVTLKLQYVGTAEFGTDYSGVSAEAIIPAGETSVTLRLYAETDSLTEKSEAVSISIRGGEGYAALGVSSATINIVDTTQKRKSSALIRPGRP